MKGLSKGRYDETFAGEDGYKWGLSIPVPRFFHMEIHKC